MVDWNISAVAFLLVFVSFYVISLSTYTYISSLSNVNLTLKKIKQNDSNRLRRDAIQKYNTDLWVKDITLNKCCGQNQIMNYHNNCESQEYKIFNPSDIIEKLEFFVVDENLATANINSSRIHFAYNYYNPGFIEDAVVVNWVLNDAKVKTNYLFLQEDGSLLEMDHNSSKVDKKFSTNAYCLDENNYFGSGLIAYINPCVENLCIRKCCPKGWYYNTIQQDCAKKSPQEYKPEFYFTTSSSEKEIDYYLLVGNPTCSLADSLTKINANNTGFVYIQEDAFLLVVDPSRGNYYYYDNRSYCVDLFSNGLQIPFVNGFYCQKEANFMRPADVDVRQVAVELLEETTTRVPYIFRDRINRTELDKGENRKKVRARKLPRPKPLYPRPSVEPPKQQINVKNSQDSVFVQSLFAVFCFSAIILL